MIPEIILVSMENCDNFFYEGYVKMTIVFFHIYRKSIPD